MAEKNCVSCKWIAEGNPGNFNCLNPINDHLYDWFNSSTTETIRSIRRASVTYKNHSCDEFSARKKPLVSPK